MHDDGHCTASGIRETPRVGGEVRSCYQLTVQLRVDWTFSPPIFNGRKRVEIL